LLGRVESVFFGIEDHGCLTLMVHLDFGVSSQGFGGFALDRWDEERNRRVGTAEGGDFVLRLLTLFGVDRLEQIVGAYVYAIRESDFGPIVGLARTDPDGGAEFMVKDWREDWL